MPGRDHASQGTPITRGASAPDRRAPAKRLAAPPSSDTRRRERSRRLTAVMAALQRARAMHHDRG